ncbi:MULTISPECIES: SPOR domain-containing protein [unclassified Thioalkalivibrio]|uniref:SPOR domain-containing protein n=1 Tax=unclassified Thioalkalivibrio TaxID=2621013 RepID=UPI00036F1EAD|nr:MULTISPECIES: SPOR domain-containing protein [unclassified Thioalkalivibrio]
MHGRGVTVSDEPVVRYRLVGAVILIALAVIFLPWLFDGAGYQYMTDAEDPVPEAPQFAEPDVPLPSERDTRMRDEAPEDEMETPGMDTSRVAEARRLPSDLDAEDDEDDMAADDSVASPETEAAQGPEPLRREGEPTQEVTSGWAVQVGSYRDGDNAREQERALRDAGLAAFVEDVTVDGETVYRVKVGPRADREAAIRLREDLEEERDLSGIVVTFP